MMRVDGNAFRIARKKLRARFPGRGQPGQPAKGTQEWIADEARLSLRAVQYLEKGEASLKTIKAISELLHIDNWEEYICDYGQEYVTCTAKKLVDFRPELYPPDNIETFYNSCVLMSIDPLSVLVESGSFEETVLTEVTAKLSGLPKEIEFVWMAEVSLTPAGIGWLGWVKEIEELYLPATDKILNLPIMFRQKNENVISWLEFIQMIENTDDNQFYIDIHLQFLRFSKNIRVFLSVELLQRLFKEGRYKYGSEYPYMAQVKTIT